jgi:hypothetical protein
MTSTYWTTREYVFAAMTSVALLVVASIVIPFTLPLRIPGLANAVNGLFGSFFLVIGLIRLRKPGSLLLITGVYSLILPLGVAGRFRFRSDRRCLRRIDLQSGIPGVSR